MFANLVRLALLAELAAWAAAGSWIHARFGWSLLGVAVLAGLGSAGIRLGLVCLTLSISWLARSPRAPAQRLGVAGTLRLVVGEWLAMLANNYVWLPLERLVVRADPPPARDSRVPVILVHGYFSNRGTLSGLVKALDGARVGPVFVPTLPAVLAPIETFAGHLDRAMEAVMAATGHARVILVCHSMGGLMARAWLAGHGAERVAGLVTIGSPHHGTVLAWLGAGANAVQMRVGSGFLRGLESREGPAGPGCRALSIHTVHDNLVAPQASSRLPWARDLEIHGVAHLAMLSDPRVHRAVIGEIEAARAEAVR